MNTLKPRIYVSCLASYNAGTHHGAWIEANQSADEINTEIQEMLTESPSAGAEEWAIHDYEDFGSIRLGEYESISTIADMAEIIEEHGKIGAEIIANFHNCLDDAKNAFEDYFGEHDSEADYAQELTESCHEIPGYIQYYIDYDKMANDMFMSDYYSIEIDGKYHVFLNV